MARTKSINGVVYPLTAEEEAAQDATEAAWAAGADDRSWAELRSRRDELLSETDWQASSDVTMTAEQLRSERNRKLTDSDFSQLDDANVDAAAWATYRQALRDLPANTEDPENVTWPTKPS